MHRFTSAEVERVRHFLAATAVPCDLTTFSSVLLPAVQDLVPSVVACFAQFDPAEGRLITQETYPRIPREGDGAEFVSLMSQHPVFEEWARTGVTRAQRRSALISLDEWRKRELYQQIYRDWRCDDSMPVALPAPDGLVACLCSERDVDFTDAELDLIEFVRPHIAQMYRGAEMFSLLSRAEPSPGVHRILLDREGRPLLATQAAWELLAGYFPGYSALKAAFPKPVRDWLEKQLDNLKHARTLPEPGASFVATKEDGARLTLRLLPGERTGEQALLVLHHREGENVRVPSRLGLSPREEEILILVRQGKTSSEIAESLFLSRRTVEKHLENIYCKLGVENRTAAVAVAFSDIERS